MNYRHINLAFLFTALFLAALFGVYQYQQQKINSLLSQTVTEITPTPTSLPELVSESTTDWQIYKNDKLGFEFSYPSIWFKLDSADSSGNIYFSTSNIASPMEMNSTDIWLSISNKVQPTKATLLNKVTKTVQDNQVTILTYGSPKIPTESGSNISYQISNKNLFIELNYFSFNQNTLKDNTAIFNQILSTFKFTYSAIPTSSQKTTSTKIYSNIGLTFSYPSTFTLANPLSPIINEGFVNQKFNNNDNSVNLLLSSSLNRKNSQNSYLSLEELHDGMSNVTYTEVNGKKIAVYKSETLNSKQQNATINLLSSDSQYIISLALYYALPEPGYADYKLVDQILSTFQFTQ